MRKLRFTFLALSICCIFQACLKNTQEPEIVGPDPLWPEVTLLWPGEDSVKTIEDFSKITKVTSSDEKVAQVVIQDKGIKISGGVPGTADIQIIGDGNRSNSKNYCYPLYKKIHSARLSFIHPINQPLMRMT